MTPIVSIIRIERRARILVSDRWSTVGRSRRTAIVGLIWVVVLVMLSVLGGLGSGDPAGAVHWLGAHATAATVVVASGES